ncbi:tyrosine-type recombinase/integrase [Exiguobacterium alkaliphilum]|uniref:tyrosine-type recombinase/integrase n=1 Tax=Exiguobacterium alkaliphilum TaxID=1428684 RepID=UPI00403AA0D2
MEHITLKDAITLYVEDLATRQQKAKKTIKSYRHTLRRFANLMEESNVSLLKDVEETAHAFPYRDEMIDRDFSLNTVKTYVMTLKAFMNYAVGKGWIEQNPFAFVNVTGAGARRQSLWISREQLDKVLYHAHNATLYNIFLIGGDAGLRISETLELKMEDIDFEHNELFVRFGKGQKSRRVPMTDRLHHSLTRYLRSERPKLETDSPYVFVMPNGHQVRSNYVNEYLRSVSEEQLDFAITSHVLRHSFATELHNRGVSITIISRLLGHSSTETTELYLHISMEQNQITISILND